MQEVDTVQKKSFVFYKSFFEALKEVPPDEFKNDITNICNYVFDNKEPDIKNPNENMFFTLVKPQLDSNLKKYLDGCKGGRKHKTRGDDTTSADSHMELEKCDEIQNNEDVFVPAESALSSAGISVDKKGETSGFQLENHWLKKEKPNDNAAAYAADKNPVQLKILSGHTEPAADFVKTINTEIQKLFSVSFSDSFYIQIAGLASELKMNETTVTAYLQWLYELLKPRKDIVNLRDYFFRTAVMKDKVSFFLAEQVKSSVPAQCHDAEYCPCCGEEIKNHSTGYCMHCGLEFASFNDSAAVDEYRKVYLERQNVLVNT